MAEPGDPLSERELDVLRCLSRGTSNKEIAADLTISENTVKVHLRNIYTKLEVSSRTEATTAAMQKGYITIPGQEETRIVDTVQEAETEAAVPTAAADTASTVNTAAQAAPSETVATPRKGRVTRFALLGAAIVLALAAALFFSRLLTDPQPTTTTEETFTETPIGNSHWLESKPMPDARANMAVATVGLDIYQIGGETAGGVDGVVRAFNSLDSAWRTVAEKPTAVADASAAELFGEIYVAGGRMSDGQPTSTVEAYSPTQDAWRPVAPLPHPVTGGLTLSDGAFLYVIGGYNGETYVDASYIYDPATDSWRPLPTIPQAVAFASGGALTGKLIVAGGQNENGELAACHLFDPAETAWSACPDMLLPRKSAGSAVLLNKFYVIGGTDHKGEITYSEMFDPDSETWQVINTPMLVESTGWPDLGVGQIETRIYTLGGRDGEAYLDRTYIFAPLVYQTYIPAASSADGE